MPLKSKETDRGRAPMITVCEKQFDNGWLLLVGEAWIYLEEQMVDFIVENTSEVQTGNPNP